MAPPRRPSSSPRRSLSATLNRPSAMASVAAVIWPRDRVMLPMKGIHQRTDSRRTAPPAIHQGRGSKKSPPDVSEGDWITSLPGRFGPPPETGIGTGRATQWEGRRTGPDEPRGVRGESASRAAEFSRSGRRAVPSGSARGIESAPGLPPAIRGPARHGLPVVVEQAEPDSIGFRKTRQRRAPFGLGTTAEFPKRDLGNLLNPVPGGDRRGSPREIRSGSPRRTQRPASPD